MADEGIPPPRTGLRAAAGPSRGDDRRWFALVDGDLPPADTTRWVARRKTAVVHGVGHGLITLDEACRRYRLSIEEFLSWRRLADRTAASAAPGRSPRRATRSPR